MSSSSSTSVISSRKASLMGSRVSHKSRASMLSKLSKASKKSGRSSKSRSRRTSFAEDLSGSELDEIIEATEDYPSMSPTFDTIDLINRVPFEMQQFNDAKAEERNDNIDQKQKQLNKSRKVIAVEIMDRKRGEMNYLQRRLYRYGEIDWDTESRRNIRKYLINQGWYNAVQTFLTIYALYSEDLRLAFAPKSWDDGIGYAALIIMILFSLDLSLQSYAEQNFFLSFFFWLDLVATISLIADLHFAIPDNEFQTSGATEAREGRAARAGIRIGQLLRWAKVSNINAYLNHYVFVNPCISREEREYRRAQKARQTKNVSSNLDGNNNQNNNNKPGMTMMMVNNNNGDSNIQSNAMMMGSNQMSDQNMMNVSNQEDNSSDDDDDDHFGDNPDYEPSKLGDYLKAAISRKVVVAVLSMVFVIPWLLPADIVEKAKITPSIQRLHDLRTDASIPESQSRRMIEIFVQSYRTNNKEKELLILTVNNEDFLLDNDNKLPKLRDKEIEEFHVDGGNTDAIFDIKDEVVSDAIKDMFNITFHIFMLMVLALVFSNDTEYYMVKPINEMVEGIRNLASTKTHAELELERKKAEEKKSLVERIIEIRRQRRIEEGTQKIKDSLETELLKGTIQKLGRLLELGFGTAGQDIVKEVIASGQGKGSAAASALSSSSSSGAGSMSADNMDFTRTGGRMINACFGFVIINDFSKTMQGLGTEIMSFVNQIASIVHSRVHQHRGAANKNIGSAFLCVWKFPDDLKTQRLNVCLSADAALYSFIKCILDIHRSPKIKYYNQLDSLQELIPGFKVRLGFGLHSGWGIEGAIGSIHKIDASYLSPNVNLAARLESGTHQFGVYILISDAVAQLLSPVTRSFCRRIDTVCVKGSAQPITLWTYDLLLDEDERISGERRKEIIRECRVLSKDHKKQTRMFNRLTSGTWRSGEEPTYYEQLFLSNVELMYYRRLIPEDFLIKYDQLFQAYTEGDWTECKVLVQECQAMLPDDGPTKVLKRVMKESNFQAPPDWEGNRQLTSK